MKFSHLVVNGCSCSKGIGLLPHEKSWAELLANELQLPLVNIAVGGSGNSAIHRRNVEYLHLNLNYYNNPLVVNVWSQYWREEVWRVNRKGYSPLSRLQNVVQTFWPLNVKTKPTAGVKEVDEDYYDKAFYTNWDDKHHFIRTLSNKLSTIALLEQYGYQYINIDYFDDIYIYESLIDKLEPWYQSMYNAYSRNPKNISGNLNCLVETLPKASDLVHAGQDAQYVIANYLHDAIIKIYTMVQHDPKPYAKLENYIGTLQLKNY